MKIHQNFRWVIGICLFLFLLMDGREARAAQLLQGSQFCFQPGCHGTSLWLDNNPPTQDVTSRNAFLEYLPLNLSPSADISPFYKISDAYSGSIHNTPAFNPSITDDVKCVGCHISLGAAHTATGALPNATTCGECHNLTHGFDFDAFLTTPHANSNDTPGKLFDQFGKGKATTLISILESPVTLYKANRRKTVSQNERIEECSVCHNYGLQYLVLKRKLGQGKIDPQVGCPACHDAHIPAPDGNHLPVVSSTVTATSVFTSSSGATTVLAVTPATGRSVSYRNLKSYKLDSTGAQDLTSGEWDRGSNFTGPNLVLVSGTGMVSDGTGASTRLTFAEGGFLSKVRVHDTLFISGVASGNANLPTNALDAGAPVTVQATLDRAGFDIVSVVDDNTLEIDPGVVAKATVTYKRSTTGTGTLSVPVPFSGSFTFEIRNMNTNVETLCGSCHTQGKYKFTAWGKKPDGTFVDLSPTHNVNVLAQYMTSGHADKEAPAFAEFSARPYGGTHVTTYPFDMSIRGTGGVGSLRNKGNTTFVLTQTPSATNAYLSAVGNTSLPVLTNGFQCYQCHNGVGTIDYLLDRQGTAAASVLWGDANPNCYTCHDPHTDQNGGGHNIRVPAKLSFNPQFVDAAKNPRGGINAFLDGTNIPANVENGIICLFCHQGRESGLTVYLAIKSKVDPYTNPTQVIDAVNGVSFINPHYLESGAILWSRNAWEFFFSNVAQKYSNGIPAHQELNCMGCHIGEANASNSEGGHTFRPRLETCVQCHTETSSFGPITAFSDIPALGDYDGNGVVDSAFKEIGTIGDPVLGDSGLFGQLKAALAAQSPPIYYDPDTYPYFFADAAKTTTFKAFTTNTLTAAFNLAFTFKSGNCVPYHNAYYGAQILQDSLKALGVDTSTYFRPEFLLRGATDYRTIIVNP